MRFFKNDEELVAIAKDRALPSKKRVNAVKKIKNPAVLKELAIYTYKTFPSGDEASAIARDRAMPLITLEDIINNNYGGAIYAIHVASITDQGVLIWLAQNGSISMHGNKTTRQLAAEKVSDPDTRAALLSKIKQDYDGDRQKFEGYKKEQAEKKAAQRNEWNEKGLCPKCGGNFRYQIRSRQKNPNLSGYMAADSRNLEPVEIGTCLKCSYEYTRMSPEEVQKMWKERDEITGSGFCVSEPCVHNWEYIGHCTDECLICGEKRENHDFMRSYGYGDDAVFYEADQCQRCGKPQVKASN